MGLIVGVALCGHPSLENYNREGDQRQENCRGTRAGIVIALKRNGAYAGDIQVQQLG